MVHWVPGTISLKNRFRSRCTIMRMKKMLNASGANKIEHQQKHKNQNDNISNKYKKTVEQRS